MYRGKAGRSLAISLAVFTFVGCGGSDSGSQAQPISQPPVLVPAPTPTPAPAPPPSAAGTVTLSTLGLTGGGLGDFSRLEDAPLHQVVISDIQVPNANRYEDFNFDSTENLIFRANGTSRYNEEFPSSQFKGTPKVQFNAVREDLSTNPVRELFWDVYSRSNASRADLVIPNLEEVRKTAANAELTGNYPEHVMLTEIRFPEPKYIKSFQLVGSRTSGSTIPIQGSLEMVGEAFGSRYPATSSGPWVYIGDSVIQVDFTSKRVSGRVIVEQFLTGFASRMVFDISASLLPDGSFSGQVNVRGDTVSEVGHFVGALYGPGADEVGILINTSGSSGTNLLGLIAGYE